MPLAFVGDVHGCSQELERLLERLGAAEVVLLGDLFRKGPDPGGVWRLIRRRGLTSVLGNHDAALLAHATGGRPDAESARCTRLLDAEGGDWREWLASLPLFLETGDFTAVHAGLHPSGRLERTSRAMALNMRRFPPGDPQAPFWWQVYEGSRRVVFGHDALRGLVRVERDGQPWVIGLDTGCVYGGALSAYLPAEDRVLQEPAARVYLDPT